MQSEYLNRGRCGGGIYPADSKVEFVLTIYPSRRRIYDGCAQETEGSGRADREEQGQSREQRHRNNTEDGERAGSEWKWRCRRSQSR